MDELIKIVNYSQIDESVGQAIETMQLPPDMADDLFAMFCDWLTENDYEIVEEN
jgi:hypothetical protein